MVSCSGRPSSIARRAPPRSYADAATANGWEENDERAVNLDPLVPFLEGALHLPHLTGAMRGEVERLIRAINAGGMTVADAHAQLRVIEEYVVPGDQNPTTPMIADVIAGGLVAALGRATGGEFTRAVFAGNPSAAEAFFRAFGDTISLNLLPYIEALGRDMFTDATFGQSLQGAYATQDRLGAAHPWATLAGRVGASSVLAIPRFLWGAPFRAIGMARGPASNIAGAAAFGAVASGASGRDWDSRIHRAGLGAIAGGAWSGFHQLLFNRPLARYLARLGGRIAIQAGVPAAEQYLGW